MISLWLCMLLSQSNLQMFGADDTIIQEIASSVKSSVSSFPLRQLPIIWIQQ